MELISSPLCKPFLKIARWAVERVTHMLRGRQAVLWERIPGGLQVRRDLARLHAGCTERELALWVKDYYTEKLALTLAVLCGGFALSSLLWIGGAAGGSLVDNSLERGEFQEPQKFLTLGAQIAGYKEHRLDLTLAGKMPSREEADRVELLFWEELQQVALGENRGWEEVWQELSLEERLEGYPFAAQWSSEDTMTIDTSGTVRQAEEGQRYPVRLTVKVTYEQWEWTHTVQAVVVPRPVSREEQLYQELEQYIEELEKNTRTSEELALPESWQEHSVTWTEQRDNPGAVIGLVAAVAGVAVFFLQDKDLHGKLKVRQELMREDYPLIVSKLLLYLGAGLTLRGAFRRMEEEYRRARASGGRERPACEELGIMCRAIETGQTEKGAYEQFGKRCGLTEYVRLSALLAGNVMRGGDFLMERLREEAEEAMKAQINRSRKNGEAVSAKLIFPMMLMLAVVMIMIMVPAFGNM